MIKKDGNQGSFQRFRLSNRKNGVTVYGEGSSEEELDLGKRVGSKVQVGGMKTLETAR